MVQGLSTLEELLILNKYDFEKAEVIIRNPSRFRYQIMLANAELIKKFLGEKENHSLFDLLPFSRRKTSAPFYRGTLMRKLISLDLVRNEEEAETVVPELIAMTGEEQVTIFRSKLFGKYRKSIYYHFNSIKRQQGNLYFAVRE